MLAAGTTLGPFKILAPLGAGGWARCTVPTRAASAATALPRTWRPPRKCAPGSSERKTPPGCLLLPKPLPRHSVR